MINFIIPVNLGVAKISKKLTKLGVLPRGDTHEKQIILTQSEREKNTAKSMKKHTFTCIFTLYNCHTANVKQHTICIRQILEYKQKALLRTNLLPFCIYKHIRTHTYIY